MGNRKLLISSGGWKAVNREFNTISSTALGVNLVVNVFLADRFFLASLQIYRLTCRQRSKQFAATGNKGRDMLTFCGKVSTPAVNVFRMPSVHPE
jgi:hypothetical protein